MKYTSMRENRVRRRVVCVALCACSAPHVALRAQPSGRKWRIAFLGGAAFDSATRRSQGDPFIQGLRELGYLEGQNIRIDYRWAEGRPERLPALQRILLHANVSWAWY